MLDKNIECGELSLSYRKVTGKDGHGIAAEINASGSIDIFARILMHDKTGFGEKLLAALEHEAAKKRAEELFDDMLKKSAKE